MKRSASHQVDGVATQASGSGAPILRNKRGRFYSVVELINQLEKEKLLGKASNLAKQLVQMDAVIG